MPISNISANHIECTNANCQYQYQLNIQYQYQYQYPIYLPITFYQVHNWWCVIRGWRKSWRRWLILVEWSWELLLLLSSTALLAVRSLLRCILAVGQAWLKFTRKYRNNLPALLFPSWSPNLTFLHFSFLSTQKYNMAQQGNQMILNRFVRLQFEFFRQIVQAVSSFISFCLS